MDSISSFGHINMDENEGADGVIDGMSSPSTLGLAGRRRVL